MLNSAQIGTADEMKELATSHSYELEVEAAFVGNLILTAARSGRLKVIVQHELSEELAEELESKGYKIVHTPISDAPQYIICWDTSEAEESSQQK